MSGEDVDFRNDDDMNKHGMKSKHFSLERFEEDEVRSFR